MESDKNLIKVVGIAVFNKDGQLLIGTRRDNGKYTFPGGHLKESELPLKGAVRELLEETGIKPNDMEYLGNGTPNDSDLLVYCYKTIYDGEVTNKEDPDKEIKKWDWIDVSNGIPKEIKNNLHAPKNILLQFLGLSDSENLEKNEILFPLLDKAELKNKSVFNLLGIYEYLIEDLEAAKFLVNGQDLTESQLKLALSKGDGNSEIAALIAYGLEPNELNIKRLRDIKGLKKLNKSEIVTEKSCKFEFISPVLNSGNEVAEEIRRASKETLIYPIKLSSGKYSNGTLIAKDPVTSNSWLLKPNPESMSPALGLNEELATSSQREAAFYAASKVFRLESYLPQTELLLLDNNQYATIKTLPWNYRNVQEYLKQDPNFTEKLLLPYLLNGTIHQLSIMFYILGECDAHSGNLLCNEKGFYLIDHGSSFAGKSYNPGNDSNTYVPYILRYKKHNFNNLSPEDKYKSLPKIPPILAFQLTKWLETIDIAKLSYVIRAYNINPEACINRLLTIKTMSQTESIDIVINKLYTNIQ